jgi:serine/threonine protein kinase
VHRDLKLSNIVFARPESNEIRVVDFGISGLHGPLYNKDKSIAGSLKYMAPEVLSGKNTSADPAIDIFSLGVILFSLVVGHLPFEGDDNMIKQNIKAGVFDFPAETSLTKDVIDLIRQLLHINPKERITMKHIQSHSWVKKKQR